MSNFQLHKYDFYNKCIYCKKSYDPQDTTYCKGYEEPVVSWGAKCDCGAEKTYGPGLLPHQHSSVMPCSLYRKEEKK